MIRFPAPDEPPAFLAELGQTGGADVAAYVEAVAMFANAGAWGVKVQMIDPTALASPTAAPYWQTSRYADTQAESFAKAGCVPHDGWGPVRAACERHGLAFVATPFDLSALGPLAELEPDAVKVASGDITWPALLAGVSTSFAQVILSTGAAYAGEVRAAVRELRAHRDPPFGSPMGLAVLVCTLAYPTATDAAHLARLDTMREEVGSRVELVGLSDHTFQADGRSAMAAGAAAGVMGARLVEKHCCLPLAGPVPDLDMALTPAVAADYIDGLAMGAAMRGTRALSPQPEEYPARLGARRSLHLVRPKRAGERLVSADLAALRPGNGVTPEAGDLLGCRVAEDVEPGMVVGAVVEEGAVKLTVERG